MRVKSAEFYPIVIWILVILVNGCTSPSLRAPSGSIGASFVDSESDQQTESSDFEHLKRRQELAEDFNQRELMRSKVQSDSGEEKFVSTSDQLSVEPKMRRSYSLRSRVTRDDFIDSSSEEGSLWASNGQTNYFFTKNKVRTPGDLISLVIENEMYKEIGFEIKKSLNLNEQSAELTLLSSAFKQKSLQDLYVRNPALFTKDDSRESKSMKDSIERGISSLPQNNSSDSRNESNSSLSELRKDLFLNIPKEIQEGVKTTQNLEDVQRLVHQISVKNVNIFPALELQPGDSMAGQILERYSNGNYKVRTIKRVFYRNGKSRFVKIVGTVKGADMGEDTDLINSGKLYEYRVEVAQ